MKKLTILGLVIVLLAFSAMPVFAAGPNGHGHGNGGGQGNGVGNQTKQQDKEQKQLRHSSSGQGMRNQTVTHRTPFYLQGTISSVDGGNFTITVLVHHGNARVKQFIGADLVLATTNTTKYFEVLQGEDTEPEGTGDVAPAASSTGDDSSTGKIVIGFADLESPDIVAIHGYVVGEVYTATVITVYDSGVGGLPEVEQP